MAVNNPENLYTGGAVEFNSQPIVNTYSQLMSRKKAKEEALDEYDRQRILSVNPQGVRDRDRQGFDQRLQKIQLFYNTNKDKIRKGGTPEAYEYEKLFRDVGSYINQSKERTAKQDAAMKFYQDKLKQDGRVPDDFMKELEINDKGIDEIVTFDKQTGEPIKSSTFDLKKWLDIPKPFNRESYVKGMADIKRTSGTPRYEKVDGDPLKQVEIIEDKFDKDAKGVIAARAADKYQNSYSFAETVKSAIADPNNRKELADLFVAEYGTPPVNPEDYAAAYSLQLLQPTVTRSKPVENKSAVMDRTEAFRREMFDKAEAGRNSRAAMNSQKPGLGDYDVLGTYNGKTKLTTVKVSKADGWGTEEKEVLVVPANLVDVKDKKLIGDVRPVTNEKGEKYYIVKEDGDWEGANGQVISRVNAAKSNMDATSLNEVKRGRLDKNLVPNANPGIRPPKKITDTKMTTKPKKPSWAN